MGCPKFGGRNILVWYTCVISCTQIPVGLHHSDGPMSEITHPELHEPLAELVFVSTTVLQQALDLVTDILTDDDQLTTLSKFLPGSTIGTTLTCSLRNPSSNRTQGKHLRHARDHFTLLLDCIASNEPYIFSYDTRSRNTPMESSLSAARIAVAETITRVKNISPLAKLDQQMTLNAVTPFLRSFETTFGREVGHRIAYSL